MNFLAHLYLSGPNDELMVGNFLGDFVKGSTRKEGFSQGIIHGIELHRAIDTFTDDHHMVTLSKKRLRPKYSHYSPVIVDMFYDHLLARNWEEFSSTPLTQYAARVYQLLTNFRVMFPEDAQYVLRYMIKGNWLVDYKELRGLDKALTGMSKRTRFDSKMNEASKDLMDHYENFENEFKDFFPDLSNFAASFRKNMGYE